MRLRGTVPVALPPADAFHLFTASGERRWAHGWDPEFPDPRADETVPGTVFVTRHGDEATTWVVATALDGGTDALHAFADRYEAYLESWREAISVSVAAAG